jgi:hypothetical protein
LVLQPRLDGAGGRFWGEEDAYGFAVLDAATEPSRDQRDDAGRARADNLQAWLHHTCPNDIDAEGAGTSEGAPSGGQVPAHLLAAAAQAGDLTHEGPATAESGEGDAAPDDDPAAVLGSFVEGLPGSVQARIAAGRDLVPPKLLVRFDLASLLDHTQVPADLLTRLVGGKLRLTSAAARQVIDRAGAQIRAVVVDDGEVVGVGRATRVPPGWLTDAIHATHDTCTGPLCDRPALGADIDHAVPWTPDGDTPGGPTNLDNLGPLCAGTNRDRAAVGWEPVQYPGNGMRTWHHERSGLTTTSVPATWRPPGHRARMAALTGEPPDDPDPPHDAGGDPPPF